MICVEQRLSVAEIEIGVGQNIPVGIVIIPASAFVSEASAQVEMLCTYESIPNLIIKITKLLQVTS